MDSFAYNLRLPGQVVDGQAGIHANGYRDFDPATGRYVESDPIGLTGGINTYVYGDQNPTSEKDPTGQNGWGGLDRGISPTEAQALSVVQQFNYWFNTPDPCTKAYLDSTRAGKLGSWSVGFFSLLSLTAGPWNMSGTPQETGMEYEGLAAKKPAAEALAHTVSWGAKALSILEGVGTGLMVVATAENIHAFSKCGCNGPPR